ncbi:MAG TPA: hypothetical protein PKM59_16135 [Thermodesulfobacteriota bacterium]|nr:hypothetical protein [Thermodesulfobacteriota bacterium]HNU71836.1 hypothetical protein [Thermodesulfobacteriota bacterium]
MMADSRLTQLPADEYKKGIKEIEEAARFSYTKRQLTFIYDAIKQYGVKEFWVAINYLVSRSMPNRAPMPSDIIDAVRTEVHRMGYRPEQQEKRDAEDFLYGKPKQKSPQALEAITLIREFLGQKMTIKVLIDRMRMMGDKYGNQEWHNQANILARKRHESLGDAGGTLAGNEPHLLSGQPGLDVEKMSGLNHAVPESGGDHRQDNAMSWPH